MRNLIAPATNLFYKAEVSARRYPDKPFMLFYDTAVTFAEFSDEAQRVAGFLERECGVRKGDRVPLLMQNSSQFVIGYYGILPANAVVVPLNPMNLTQEILRYAKDSGARTAIVSQERLARVELLLANSTLKSVIVAAYSDYLKQPTTLAVPDFVSMPRMDVAAPGCDLVVPCAGLRRTAGASHGQPGRFMRDAPHLGHHGRTQGLHAYAQQCHAYTDRRYALVRVAA